MKQIREVLRQKWELDRSHREVAESTSVSIGAVSNVLKRAVAAQLESWAQVAVLTDEALELQLYGRRVAMGGTRPPPDPVWIHTERQKTGVTLELLHEEYKLEHPDGYGLTQFCQYYSRWLAKSRLSMRQVHKPGDKLFVDYSGKKPRILHPETMKPVEVELFAAVLGASSLTYAEATWTQAGPDFIGCHVHAFEFLGGAPAAVVPDQCKTAVTRSCWYDPDVQRTYQEMAEHYGCAVLPARPRRPKDKAKVERGVQLVQRWILARIRNEVFVGLDALNERIRELLEIFNRRPMRTYGGQSRLQRFEELDKPFLQALPTERFEYAVWKKAKVNIDYHVDVDQHFYSVPYTLYGEAVETRKTAATVEIFHRGQRIASHLRSTLRHKHTTLHGHMPKAHQEHLEWPPSRVLSWAHSIGRETGRLIETILGANKHPEHGYRPSMGILRLSKRYGKDRLERAAARANHFGAFRYKAVENILKHGMDRLPLPSPTTPPSTLPVTHENIRGSGYYQ